MKISESITSGDLIGDRLQRTGYSMVAKCSDEHAVSLAEQIAEDQALGISTHDLEEKLKLAMAKMFLNTRILNGRIKPSNKY